MDLRAPISNQKSTSAESVHKCTSLTTSVVESRNCLVIRVINTAAYSSRRGMLSVLIGHTFDLTICNEVETSVSLASLR